MKKVILNVFILLMAVTGLSAQDKTATEIIKEMDQRTKGTSSQGEMKMTIVRPTWKREMRMKTWAKGDDLSLVLVTSPARDKGIAYLKRFKEMWNWQPSIDRNVKMPPSMMMQSWMGSDFKNDDLVKQSSIVNDYTHKLIGSETVEGRDCYKIELIPTEEAAVVWGKVISWVDKKDYLQLKTEFYDEDEYLVNTMLGKKITEFDGRLLPAIMEIIPADEEGHKTIIEQLTIKFNTKMDDKFFSVQNMKRIR
ncbi:MAG: outer membrane lipoprotein-sorting protein [Aureispira sp.]|nr:outer membrane lipoprotein-sorting protein [Aureispira sp.]